MSTLWRSIRSQVSSTFSFFSLNVLSLNSLFVSDLLSRHVNKCHASEKPPTTTAPNRRKGSASASRATTSKQACDQCVVTNLPCDGSNPCCTSLSLSLSFHLSFFFSFSFFFKQNASHASAGVLLSSSIDKRLPLVQVILLLHLPLHPKRLQFIILTSLWILSCLPMNSFSLRMQPQPLLSWVTPPYTNTIPCLPQTSPSPHPCTRDHHLYPSPQLYPILRPLPINLLRTLPFATGRRQNYFPALVSYHYIMVRFPCRTPQLKDRHIPTPELDPDYPQVLIYHLHINNHSILMLSGTPYQVRRGETGVNQ
jgi:hypothetical protein